MNFSEVLHKHGIIGSLKRTPIWLRQQLNQCKLKKKLWIAKFETEDFYIVKDIQGSKMLLNLNDAGISRELYFTGIHEAESTAQYKKELQPGMTIFELGANIGYYALIGAKAIGDTGRVIAFEPSPVNMETFRQNVTLNGLNNRIETYQRGIANINGIMKFNVVNKGNMSSFYKRREDGVVEQVETIDVDVTTLDAFIEEHPQKIDYMRMDVEGFEYEIFQGMQNVLKSKYAPEGFFIEIHSELLNENGHSCREFVENLHAHSYDISIARWRGKPEFTVHSVKELLQHERCEIGYWEAFLKK